MNQKLLILKSLGVLFVLAGFFSQLATSQSQKNRTNEDNLIAAGHVLLDLSALGLVHGGIDTEKFFAGEDARRLGLNTELKFFGVSESAGKIAKLKNQFEAVLSDPNLNEIEKNMKRAQLLDQIKKETHILNQQIKIINNQNVSVEVNGKNSGSKFKDFNVEKDGLFSNEALKKIESTASSEASSIRKNLDEFVKKEIKNDKAIKRLKAATIVGGVLFAVDIGGQVWAYYQDQPAPLPIPAAVAIGGTINLVDTAINYLRDKKPNKIERGSVDELLKETSESEKKNH